MTNLNQFPQRGRADELGRLAEKAGRLEIARNIRMILADLMGGSANARNTGNLEGRSPTREEKVIWNYVENLLTQGGATPDEVANR